MFFIFYAWHGIGIAIGYHRLLSHRSFKCPKFVEYFFVGGGYLGFMSSPIWWVASHRAHHRYTDTELDPHSPRQGFWHSHCGWFFIRNYPAHIDPIRQCPDLLSDPVYRFLECNGDIRRAHLTNSAIGFGSRAILWMLFGWEVALASVLAGIVVQQIPLFLNALCHMPFLGYKTYNTTDDSVNFWPMGVLAFGEGWHNNHHAYPGSARTGLLPHEVDISWLIIKSLKMVGLAENVNEATPSKPQEGNLELQPIPVESNETRYSLSRRD
jgi:sn-1 stearoyl-lipid 9-desaturase